MPRAMASSSIAAGADGAVLVHARLQGTRCSLLRCAGDPRWESGKAWETSAVQALGELSAQPLSADVVAEAGTDVADGDGNMHFGTTPCFCTEVPVKQLLTQQQP